jgi:hypothetical protein
MLWDVSPSCYSGLWLLLSDPIGKSEKVEIEVVEVVQPKCSVSQN